MKRGEKTRTIFIVLPQLSWDILLTSQKHKNKKMKKKVSEKAL